MAMKLLDVLLLLLVAGWAAGLPNIVLLVADDMGWNDVSWNNADMLTPNLQWMADRGVILSSSYVQPMCTPTRAAFLTGRFPYKIGFQRGVVSPYQPKYMDPVYATVAEKLKTKNYETHLVGKWHLGHCNWAYTPTYRGFDTHNGLLLGAGDHYEHTTKRGFDFRNGTAVDHSYDDVHSTDAFTDLAKNIISNHDTANPLFLYLAYQAPHTPLDPPAEYEALYSSDDTTGERQRYSGLVTHMDHSIGQIREALENATIMDNTVIVFISDNGGTGDAGNNLPLRGKKTSLNEGGVRTPGMVYSPLLTQTGYTHPGLIHAVDWHATFLDLADITPDEDIDGVSQWDMLQNGADSSRTEFVYGIDTELDQGAIRVGDYKLTKNIALGDFYDIPTANRRKRDTANHRVKRQGAGWKLFNIADDPEELNDLKNIRQTKQTLIGRYEALALDEVTPFEPADDQAAADPSNNGNVWVPNWC